MIAIIEADLQQTDHQQAIVELLDAYARIPLIHGKPLTDEVKRNLIPGLQRMPTALVLLAYEGTRPVGLAICFGGFSTFAAQPLLNLHDIAVAESHRGQGVGRQLLDAVEAKAREQGCCKVTLEVDRQNDRARHVYQAAGYTCSNGSDLSDDVMFLKKAL